MRQVCKDCFDATPKAIKIEPVETVFNPKTGEMAVRF